MKKGREIETGILHAKAYCQPKASIIYNLRFCTLIIRRYYTKVLAIKVILFRPRQIIVSANLYPGTSRQKIKALIQIKEISLVDDYHPGLY